MENIVSDWGIPKAVWSYEKFSALMVPDGSCCKGVIIIVILTPTGVLPKEESYLRRKEDVMGAYIYAPRNRKSTYV